MSNLNGRVIAVTGGSKGFGLAIATALVEQGACVALLARRESELQAAVAKLGADKAAAFVADAADPDALKQAFAALGTHFGRLDGLVNNAGVARPSPLAEVTPDELALQWQLNVGGVIFTIQAALPLLRQSDNPRIVNITSASARHTDEMSHLGVYASTKAAVERLTVEWRTELLDEGIAVTAVSPGFAATDFAAGWDFERLQKAAAAWREKGPTFYEGMDVSHIGQAVAHCFSYPRGAAVDFVEVRPNRPVAKPVF